MLPIKFIPALALFILLGCSQNSKGDNPVEVKVFEKAPVFIEEEIVIDDAVINEADVQKIIDPLWWAVDIYQSEEIYKEGLKRFSANQKYVFAIQWYLAEVNNGGHDQFFTNSTGIVWKDALDGFEKIGLKENYSILKAAADKLGGNPSLDRDTRQAQYDKMLPDFEKLDDRFFDSDKRTPIDSMVFEFIKLNRKDFYFRGKVKKPL
jgi:hypothetical protein